MPFIFDPIRYTPELLGEGWALIYSSPPLSVGTTLGGLTGSAALALGRYSEVAVFLAPSGGGPAPNPRITRVAYEGPTVGFARVEFNVNIPVAPGGMDGVDLRTLGVGWPSTFPWNSVYLLACGNTTTVDLGLLVVGRI